MYPLGNCGDAEGWGCNRDAILAVFWTAATCRFVVIQAKNGRCATGGHARRAILPAAVASYKDHACGQNIQKWDFVQNLDQFRGTTVSALCRLQYQNKVLIC